MFQSDGTFIVPCDAVLKGTVRIAFPGAFGFRNKNKHKLCNENKAKTVYGINTTEG